MRRRGIEGATASAASIAAISCAVACSSVGSISNPGQGSGAAQGSGTAGSSGGSGPGGTLLANSCTPTSPIAGRTPLRRLITPEYGNSVRDLFNDTMGTITGNTTAGFPNEVVTTSGFLNNADAYQTQLNDIQAWMTAAETIAANAHKSGFFALPCATSNPQTCATNFIKTFGLKVFRRPLTDAEVTSYYGRFTLGSTQTGAAFQDGLEWVVGRMLQSPNFLYRIELDASRAVAGQKVVLNAYSIATRLSYLLWQSTPDDALLNAAGGGQLDQPAGISGQVDRMMKDDRFHQTLTSFDDQWIGFAQIVGQEKSNTISPVWNASLQSDLRTEADLFVREVYDNGGTVSQLLTGQYSYVSPTLAMFYGTAYPGPAGSTSFVRVASLPHRYGILTLPAILATQAHADRTAPVLRGKLVRNQILCQSVPDPPPNVNTKVTPPMPGQTTRQFFEAHRSDASCAACHNLLDPLGMPFENYDEFGRWRDVDEGLPVDPSGQLTGVPDATDPKTMGPQTIAGPQGYGQQLAALAETQGCFVKEWYQYAMGHNVDTMGGTDACPMTDLQTKFKASGGNLRQLIVDVATSNGFRYRVNQ
jgi:Protein of unknown function (DUF1592)/Protein of unknown function (DUF1588)/Protein of unknown function (DUF1595)/Protein of unknown function (DUF1587)/Protein of unknown function (DUF1585)